MVKTSINTGARSYAARALLAASAVAAILAVQISPSEARSRRHQDQSWRASQGAMESGQGTGRTFSGVASHYGMESGNKTASGQRMNPSAMTAAHRTLPFGTKVRVTHGSRSIVVTINDRGPFIKGRVIDLSTGAARAIGINGIGRVTAEVVS